MRFFYIFVFFITSLSASNKLAASDELVLVTVAPYVKIVDELTGSTVQVELMVPAGFSSHTYEPTPKQVIQATKAKIWFTIGELFEKKALAAIQSDNPNIAAVDLRNGLKLLQVGCCHDHAGADPHIWMSPKMMQTQVSQMAQALEKAFPERADSIKTNLKTVVDKLQKLDDEIKVILEKSTGKLVFVSHPAYGYFCQEFGLTQIPIEFEGKDPTPKKITKLIQQAKEAKVKVIFTQKQYSSKAADLVAHEIGAHIVELDPYSQDYFTSMRHIAKSFAGEDSP
jgi:zinc transport system substrate-binding protein